MKAKALAQIYKESPSQKTLSKIILHMESEVTELINVRQIDSQEGMRQLNRQQEDKWQAFCRLCPEVNPGLWSISHAAACSLSS